MAKYRKKPVVIDAFRLTKKELERMNRHQFSSPTISILLTKDHLIIATLEGDMKANIGDWVITGVNGELYPCKPDIFEKTYEKV